MNALTTVREFKEADDEVKLIFDGAGTKWVAELAKPENRMHGLFEGVKDKVAGVCAFCADAFGAKDAALAAGIPLLDEYAHHPSVRRLVADGYEVITF